jgi:hypothetical protein
MNNTTTPVTNPAGRRRQVSLFVVRALHLVCLLLMVAALVRGDTFAGLCLAITSLACVSFTTTLATQPNQHTGGQPR